ncbi:hypothetical protein OOK60_14630 [Trichothermofontia sichuanensis B231]|uniref:hypothetical protein n=1 Tax=Trichothermofontia sichuanensis TaxID=3045816 RepID=UPI0022479616|nr:hypothetical protein [Trichothermofontia sichuanensis]UZQ53719.1 hypothetical protein OOK60_14630 [Trichothermofontia sichuanensis B231]
MEISRPQAPAPTPEELEDLEKLKAVIDRAVADGKITQGELAQIRSLTIHDGKITPQEVELYRTLIIEKINKGELTWGWH